MKIQRRKWQPMIFIRNMVIVLVFIIVATVFLMVVANGFSKSMDIDYCKFNRNPHVETFEKCMEGLGK
jgi:hypothetical protein